MTSAIENMLPGLIALATIVAYMVHRERSCNRDFNQERDKWKDVRDE